MNIILMILLISLLIFVHELGHFTAAKLCGMKVSKFGFGLPFGPTLYEKQFGETTFCIHAFLLGGYVSFPDDEKDSGVPDDSPELFKNKPVGQRAFVAVAGVTANVICAVILVLFTAFVWGKLPAGKFDVFVSKLHPEINKTLISSTIQPEDKIVSINGTEIIHYAQVTMYARAGKAFNGKISKQRAEEQFNKIKELNPKANTEEILAKGTKIILPKLTNEEPVKLSKVSLMGIQSKEKTNDIYLTTEQKQLNSELRNKKTYIADGNTTLKDVAIATADTYEPLNFIVERNGKQIELKPILPNENGIIGIEQKISDELYAKTDSFKSGMVNSYKYLKKSTTDMIWGLGQMFVGHIPMKELHGIVAITKVGGDIIEQQGLFKGILMTAVISINLAIVNLLPIPALDGGHLLFLLVEKIRGKAIDEKTVEILSNFCFYLLIVLMIAIIFNDIWAIITKKF